ncbi:MAG: malate synthase A [Robiginitomaculum sp.]|nr:MAG: malate synthase A [Robiginitomaculum sp.]
MSPQSKTPDGVSITGKMATGFEEILSHDALAFIADLHRRFNGARLDLLENREEMQEALDAGLDPDFDFDTADIRTGDWKVQPAPADLTDRRVEITGPVDRKMIINALNCGAKVFMADFEDASSPTWSNMVDGQINLRDANRRTITFTHPTKDKTYQLNEQTAVLVVRPRGWHLEEAHVLIDGEPISGSLFDFGLYLFHNHAALAALGSGPYYYLPKLENAQEARLWNLVMLHAQSALGLVAGTVRVTVLIETILASLQVDEILYELRDHICGLNCGRWDYIFSYIKRFKNRPDKLLPDRAEVLMSSPFMHAYSRNVIEICHRRGAHAIGGMAAQIPVKNDEEANAAAYAKVRADKEREVRDGHDGTWVAHPGMVALAIEVFDAHMSNANQIERQNGFSTDAKTLTTPSAGSITMAGVRTNVEVGILYVAAWLNGQGAVPIHNLMEDAATAEISRAQLWQWRVHSAKLESGAVVDTALLEQVFAEVDEQFQTEYGEKYDAHKLEAATRIMKQMVFDDEFAEFLTLPAYQQLISA